MRLRPPISSLLTAIVLLIGLAALGCAGGQVLSGDDEATRVLERLRERRDSIQTATYRVRWRAVGVDPHAEFILEIAYRAPEQYRIVATGPFGLPAFTAVVIGDDFTFVNHRDGRFITDELANLIDYEFPVAEFFEGPWRDLFGGGWGGSREVEHLTRVGESDRFTAQSGGTDWTIKWNRGKNGPASVAARANNDDGVLVADVWFDDFHRDRAPFWNLDRLVLRGVADGGEHRWKLLKQDYNIPIPERFFTPLQPPPEWERPRN